MPIEWLNMQDVANELGYTDRRTFKSNHIHDYPPDRKRGKFTWWKRSTVDRMKKEIYGFVPQAK